MKSFVFSILFLSFSLTPVSFSQAWELQKPIVVNGCSFSSEGTWGHCCYEHDIAYWIGGSFQDRKNADTRLKQCIDKSGGDGAIFYRAVRIFGIHIFGKAWPRREASDMTAEELKDIQNELKLYNSIGRPLDYEFIIQENILFKPLDAEQRRLVKDALLKFSQREDFKEFVRTYQTVVGQKPSTLKYMQ